MALVEEQRKRERANELDASRARESLMLVAQLYSTLSVLLLLLLLLLLLCGANFQVQLIRF